MDKLPLSNMENSKVYWGFMQQNQGVHIIDPTRLYRNMWDNETEITIIKSGVYVRYQKLLWRRKLPILIKNAIIGWFLILCPTFVYWILIYFVPGIPEPIWFLTGTFAGIWGLFIYLQTANHFPRAMRDIRLNRKCYLGYNIKYL